MVVHEYSEDHLVAVQRSPWLTHISIGNALTDALDSFITDGRMEPQVALKVLATFDRVVAEVLAEKVKARLSFKVIRLDKDQYMGSADMAHRDISILTASATKSGPSSLKISTSSLTMHRTCTATRSRSWP